MLDSEEHEDSRLRQQIDAGSSNRLPSANVNVKYRQRIEKYWQTLEAANASDQTVLRKYESSADLIQRLGGTEVCRSSLSSSIASSESRFTGRCHIITTCCGKPPKNDLVQCAIATLCIAACRDSQASRKFRRSRLPIRFAEADMQHCKASCCQR